MANFVINASDILLSMLFNLLLASITILLCFFLFLIVFKNFFYKSCRIENARLQLALIIDTGAPIAVASDAIEMLPGATDKTINDLSKYSKEAIYLLIFLLINSLSLISGIKQSLVSLILFSLNC